ncbi:hypothetical protein M408DRAFT_268368 [Serendipita vermifera MAFF 305830]|uniref:Uncharacterized protein n=1 Tax=Serendipita vermifera MAFF 305830 TaxID=933852 RepID=A0A0C3AEE4_SERVB|nr:hypothetical protein M408DRAFT_268368 [Serendipita vermifera MAFF 305830]
MNNAKTVASGVSQRARKTTKSKAVFKPVLDNPFSIAWPEILQNVQVSLLEATVAFFSCLKEYHIQRGLQSRSRKRAESKARLETREASSSELPLPDAVMREASTLTQPGENKKGPDHDNKQAEAITIEPEVLQHAKFGANEVVKMLERYISTIRQSLLDKKAVDEGTITPLAVLACRWDVNPPSLFSHIPHLVASANTLASMYHLSFPDSHPFPEVKLVNLPKHAENSLSEALGMRRVSIVALNSNAILSTKMGGLLKMVPRLATPWLIPTTNPTIFVPSHKPTHIKHLKTTAPVDMRAAKQERVEVRKAAKERRKKKAQITVPRTTSDAQMIIDK